MERRLLLKICPICRRTWSGGRDCPHCGEGHPLIDVAGEQGRRTFLRDKELASAIRGYYGARTDAQEVKDALRRNTDLALARGVFGVPTIFVGERSFWGNDRLHFVETELRRVVG